MSARPTALIADDEPLLREALRRQLASAWPELEVVGEARNGREVVRGGRRPLPASAWPELEVGAEARSGREAVRLFDERSPDVCFLDVHMPGLSGVDAARHIGRRAHVVFVTASAHYAAP